MSNQGNDQTLIELANNQEISDHQLKLNYFPNDQKKHIDYVIFYKDVKVDKNLKDNDKNNKENVKILERKQMINKFLIQLINVERFEIRRIAKTNYKNEILVYLLLHGSLDRLMSEAQKLHFVLPLKDVIVTLSFIFDIQ